MVEEVMQYLRPQRGGLFLDATLGGGGHAERLLASTSDLRLIGIDQDPRAFEAAGARLARYADRMELVLGNFRDVGQLLADRYPEETLDGALLDLGVSSHQIDESARGFSFRRGTPLIMRMGGTTGGGSPAADFLNDASEQELGRVFRDYGEERRWRALARQIVKRRGRTPFKTSDDLVAAAAASLGTLSARDKARLFQAIRIEVNDEMVALDEGLEQLGNALGVGGRMVVISYHSLEDRIVKTAFREWSTACVCPPEIPICMCGGVAAGKRITRKIVRPDDAEIQINPRARSARLRVWERTEPAS
jgi:16S rRNA (cytosine1402-N4)-methyltransferase